MWRRSTWITTVSNLVLRAPHTPSQQLIAPHPGIKIELIGQVCKLVLRVLHDCVASCVDRVSFMRLQIEMFHDRGNTFPFITLEKELEKAGHLDEEKSWPFEFKQVRGC